MTDYLEEQYYQTLSDEELFKLRDSIPNFKDKYYQIEEEFFNFFRTLDIDQIEFGMMEIQKYQAYREYLLSLKNYKNHLNKLNTELSKAFFFKKESLKDQIIQCEKKIEELAIILKKLENQEGLLESFNNEEYTFYWSVGDYLDKYTSTFYKSFRRLYKNEIKALNSKFKSIYYRIDRIEVSEKDKPITRSDAWWKWDRDYEEYNHQFITLRNKYRFRFCVKTYNYLTRWDLKYFPYFLGEIFHKYPSGSIKIIDKVLLSRNNDVLIQHLRDLNDT